MFTLPKDKPSLLDTFCKAGGCARGYQRAGFYVVGVDNEPQPNYVGDEFYQADAIEFIKEFGYLFDGIHASPPCQAYSRTKTLTTNKYPKLIEPLRKLLMKTGKFYIIENVEGAPLINYIKLCGTMFGLRVIRHRLFENNIALYFPPFTCAHVHSTAKRGEYDRGHNGYITIAGNNYVLETGKKAMKIDWMTRKELNEAIPPAYTEWLGGQLINALKAQGSLTKHAQGRRESPVKETLSTPEADTAKGDQPSEGRRL